MTTANESLQNTHPFSVGQSVRVELPQSNALRRTRRKRGLIATIHDDDDDDDNASSTDETVCVILAPPITAPSAASGILQPPPTVDQTTDNEKPEEDMEVTVPLSRIQPLLDFETAEKTDQQQQSSLAEWKSRGDALFQLGDEEAALICYEHMLVKVPRIGSTVLLQISSETRSAWQLWLAEIDCVEYVENEETTTSLDVTVLAKWDPWRRQVSTAVKEETITLSATVRIVLTIQQVDPEDHSCLARALLNATRCTLSASETHQWKRASFYVQTSVLTTTCVEALLFYGRREEAALEEDSSSAAFQKWQSTLHFLRAKAWLAMGQHDLALHDANQTTAKKEAKSLQKEIAEQKQASSVQTRKLVKDMCQWIDGATTSTTEETTWKPAEHKRAISTRAKRRTTLDKIVLVLFFLLHRMLGGNPCLALKQSSLAPIFSHNLVDIWRTSHSEQTLRVHAAVDFASSCHEADRRRFISTCTALTLTTLLPAVPCHAKVLEDTTQLPVEMKYLKTLGSGSFKSVYLVQLGDGTTAALSIERLTSKRQAREEWDCIKLLESLGQEVGEPYLQKPIESILEWWVVRTPPNPFATATSVLSEEIMTSHLVHERNSIRPSSKKKYWLLAVKPRYEIDLKRWMHQTPFISGNDQFTMNPFLGKMDSDRAILLAMDLVGILQYLDANSVVHRDIKPQNCMLDQQGRAILIDFGFAQRGTLQGSKEEDLCIVEPGRVVGEVAYVWPEDVGRYQGCKRGDAYAMGKTLWEVLFESSTSSSSFGVATAPGSAPRSSIDIPQPSTREGITMSRAQKQQDAFYRRLEATKRMADAPCRFNLSSSARSVLFAVIDDLCYHGSWQRAQKHLQEYRQ